MKSMNVLSSPANGKQGQNKAPNPKVFQVLAGGPWGGGAVVVLAITRELIQRGCRVWVLCLDDLVAERFAEAGAQVVRCKNWRREIEPIYDLLSLWELYSLCRHEHFDVVVTHTSKGGFIGRVSAKLAGVPRIIHTAHGFAWHGFTKATDSLYQNASTAVSFYTFLERIAGHFCDLIISVNKEDRLEAIERRVVPAEKITTVLNGIDTDRFLVSPPVELRNQLKGTGGAYVIGTIGRLAPQKGFEYLIEAMQTIVEKQPNSRLVIVGDGPLESQLRDLAKSLDIENACLFLGFRTDIPELLASFDMYAQPSRWEGLSITMLEAMAAAKLIVASDIKGNRELIDNGVDGILVTPADSQALANNILSLMVDGENAKKMGENARHKVLEHYSQKAMVDESIRLYGLNFDH